MGHIGGELPPHPLGLRLLRHVKGQQHNTQRVAAGVDTAEVELIDPSAPLRPQLAVAGFHGAADGGAEIRVPLHRQEIPTDAVRVRVENRPCRRVDAQDRIAAVEQHQPLPHTVGDLVELILPLLQIPCLPVDFPALGMDAGQQRGQLLIYIVVQRMLQIQPVQGFHHPSGRLSRQQRRQAQRQQHHHDHRVEHPQYQHPGGFLAAGNAKHRTVRQAHGLIDGLFRQRAGVADAAAAAAGQGLPDLLPASVVFHGRRIRLRVIKHCAVHRHPCQAAGGAAEPGQIIIAIRLHRRSGKGQLLPELPLLYGAEIAVQAAGNDQQRRQQHRQGRRQCGTKNPPGHRTASQR